MIKKLDHTEPATAKEIRDVFQVSYAVEAKLLEAEDFPPLKRTLDQFVSTKTQFFGFWKDSQLAAVLEIGTYENRTLIQSLVVHPSFFRQGIGGELVRFALDSFPADVYYVETGAANEPAVLLYEKYGFKKVHEYLTDHGIKKARFEKWR